MSATLLANTGISMIVFQNSGRWNSAKVAKGYVNESSQAKQEIMNQLMSQKNKNATPLSKKEERSVEEESSWRNVQTQTSYVYNNCAFNISTPICDNRYLHGMQLTPQSTVIQPTLGQLKKWRTVRRSQRKKTVVLRNQPLKKVRATRQMLEKVKL